MARLNRLKKLLKLIESTLSELAKRGRRRNEDTSGDEYNDDLRIQEIEDAGYSDYWDPEIEAYVVASGKLPNGEKYTANIEEIEVGGRNNWKVLCVLYVSKDPQDDNSEIYLFSTPDVMKKYVKSGLSKIKPSFDVYRFNQACQAQDVIAS